MTAKSIRIGALVAGVVFCSSVALATTPPRSAPELVPEYVRVVLPNGLVVALLEHHELPIVNFQLLLKSGSVADPPGKEGLADLTLGLLRKGTRKYNAEQLAEEFDYLGAQLDLRASVEACRLSAQFLAKDAAAGLQLLQELLLNATFPKDELRKAVERRVDGIREAKDNPRRVIGAYYESFLFGQHPFGRPVGGTETSLPRISIADVKGFYNDFVRPNQAILVASGDFDAASMRQDIESVFGGWKRRDTSASQPAAAQPVSGRRVLLVDDPDATQTYFRFGNVGVRKGNDHTAVLDLVNTVFGGRFTSWLMYEMRTQNGLTYNAHSRFIERRVPGPFYVSSFTQTPETEKAIDMALAILRRLHEKGLSKEELDSARNYIRGQFPPDYETAGDLAAAIAELEFYGLDRSYVNGHTARVDSVTPQQVRDAVARYYPRDNLVFVLVGQAQEIRSIAEKYGTVEARSIDEPGF